MPRLASSVVQHLYSGRILTLPHAALTSTPAWRAFLDICGTVIATGGAGSLLVGLVEVARSTIKQREGRFGEAVAYGFILGGTGGLVVEIVARLG